MTDAKFDLAREVVIVRRRKGGGEEGHHGGAWKIAYADFMTAMMAFFLVMWLVSMTDDKTIVQIANYFNPLQLTDAAPSKRGLRDADPKTPSASTGEKKESGQDGKSAPGRKRAEAARKEKEAIAEAKLFVDPMAALDKVASAAFDLGPARDAFDGLGFTPDSFIPPGPKGKDGMHVEPNLGPEAVGTDERPENNALAGKKNAETPPSQHKEERGESEAAEQGAAGERTKDLSDRVRKALRGIRGVGPEVAVEVTSDGVLVSVMDHDSFEMFRRSSAEPESQTMRFVERIAPILREAGDKVVIRGHTDATVFRTSSYDNWRLSTARAHMVHYMLRRAGLPDERLEKIEGLADRQPRIPSDPNAAQNRRIEILLQAAQK